LLQIPNFEVIWNESDNESRISDEQTGGSQACSPKRLAVETAGLSKPSTLPAGISSLQYSGY
jgi:hypothetical protein